MRNSYLMFLLLAIAFCLHSCHQQVGRGRVIVIQPFMDFPPDFSYEVVKELKQIDSNVVLRKPIYLPLTSYYPTRDRYRADTIIKYLDKMVSRDTVIIGLTQQDISTTKGTIADWGVMGLGFEPGNACVVSSFRLTRANLNNQFYKLILHELGHTQGLPHCPKPNCVMRDAEGSNHLEEETGFCYSCREILASKGWQLN